jgi:UDP-N-acetylglucosamine 4,6-dehydratase
VPLFKRLIDSGAKDLPITDARMTRFWITLQQGVDFVVQGFGRMYGGELFVPKIPSVRITDLAAAMAPQLPHRIIGIRPGEKLHELMISRDDSLHTLEFSDHYVITPSIRFIEDREYSTNALGISGTLVDAGFKYSSDINPHFLNIPEIGKLNELA